MFEAEGAIAGNSLLRSISVALRVGHTCLGTTHSNEEQRALTMQPNSVIVTHTHTHTSPFPSDLQIPSAASDTLNVVPHNGVSFVDSVQLAAVGAILEYRCGSRVES